MTTTDCLCNSGSGGIYGMNAVYSIARSTATSIYSQDKYYVGQSATAVPIYYVYRWFLKFDTSVIPDGNTITQVNLKMVALEDNSVDADFDVVIKKCNWSAYDPASDVNKESIYDLILSSTADNNIWRNTSGISINTQYTSGNLDTAYVNKSGWTYYALLSSRDVSGTAPVPGGGGASENVRLASQDHATTGYRPVLTVVHTPAGGQPAISPFLNFFKNFENPWKMKGGIWQPKEGTI